MIVKIKRSELRQIIKEEWERSLVNEFHSEQTGFDGSVKGQDPELDFEGYMSKGQLHTIAREALELLRQITDGENLPEWMQTKISQMEDNMNSVSNAYTYDKERGTI